MCGPDPRNRSHLLETCRTPSYPPEIVRNIWIVVRPLNRHRRSCHILQSGDPRSMSVDITEPKVIGSVGLATFGSMQYIVTVIYPCHTPLHIGVCEKEKKKTLYFNSIPSHIFVIYCTPLSTPERNHCLFDKGQLHFTGGPVSADWNPYVDHLPDCMRSRHISLLTYEETITGSVVHSSTRKLPRIYTPSTIYKAWLGVRDYIFTREDLFLILLNHHRQHI